MGPSAGLLYWGSIREGAGCSHEGPVGIIRKGKIWAENQGKPSRLWKLVLRVWLAEQEPLWEGLGSSASGDWVVMAGCKGGPAQERAYPAETGILIVCKFKF